MRKRLNALWTLKLCKIPMIETQSESQTLPQHQPKKAQIPLAFGRFTFTMDYKNAFEPFSLSLNIRIKRDHIIIVFNPVQ
ncbi:hypothetical protein KVK48_00790 [Helicobacter pylori]|nr:hypothetical protein E5D93_00795 [Helicobacter pylori]WRA24067.1 hypothetical protein KVK48_00790 [Helicobacter pylori]